MKRGIEMKEILAVLPDGRVLSRTIDEEAQIHDKIVYMMFKDYFDRFEQEKNIPLIPDKEDDFFPFTKKICEDLSAMFILENRTPTLFFIPETITDEQRTYYEENYLDSPDWLVAFSKNGQTYERKHNASEVYEAILAKSKKERKRHRRN